MPKTATAQGDYSVTIATSHNTLVGGTVSLNVTMTEGIPFGGFDFLISFDTAQVRFDSVSVGQPFYGASGCGWEYFTSRMDYMDTCGSGCTVGVIHVAGIADASNGAHHPSCYLPDLPAVLFSMTFTIRDIRENECRYLPVRFIWFDCGDNTISNRLGDSLYISRQVSDPILGQIADSTVGFPSWRGAQLCQNPDTTKKSADRLIDFRNGGIDVVCNGEIDSRGDVDLNEYAYQIADAVLLAKYFIYSDTVFRINRAAQVAVSDANVDGVTLSAADLVYLIRVAFGDAVPLPKNPPPTIEARYYRDGNIISVTQEVAAAVLVVEGDVTPTLLASNMTMVYHFDGTNTHILISPSLSGSSVETFFGDFISVSGQLVSIEFSSPLGGLVHSSEVCCFGLRGNVNNLRGLDTIDLLYLAYYLFLDGDAPPCMDAADVNNSGQIDILDLDYLVNYMFRGGPTPAICP